MEDKEPDSVNETMKHWYVRLVMGIIFVVSGIFLFLVPDFVFITIAMLFSLTFLVTGSSEILSSVLYRKEISRWGWSLTTGILDFITGAILLAMPDFTLSLVIIFVGILVFYRSVSATLWSLKLKKIITSNWLVMLVIGIIGIVFSIVLLFYPFAAETTLISFSGISLMTLGVFQIYLSFDLKQLVRI